MDANMHIKRIVRTCSKHAGYGLLLVGHPPFVLVQGVMRQLLTTPITAEFLKSNDDRGYDNSPMRTTGLMADEGGKYQLAAAGQPAVAMFITPVVEAPSDTTGELFDANAPIHDMWTMFRACESISDAMAFCLFPGCPPILWTKRGAFPHRSVLLGETDIIRMVRWKENREKFVDGGHDGKVWTRYRKPSGTIFSIEIWERPVFTAIIVKEIEPIPA